MAQPIIFLDVDGVLNPETNENADWTFTKVQTSWDITLFLSHDMAAELWAISTDIRWATSWAHTEDSANPNVGSVFGWPKLPTPMVGYPRRFGSGAMWVKSAVVRDELMRPGPPVVWIDDNCQELLALPAATAASFDLLGRLIWCAPNPRTGLTKRHLDDIRVELGYRAGWAGHLQLNGGRK